MINSHAKLEWCSETAALIRKGLTISSRLASGDRKRLVCAITLAQLAKQKNYERALLFRDFSSFVRGLDVRIEETATAAKKVEDQDKPNEKTGGLGIPRTLLARLLGDVNYTDNSEALDALEASVSGWLSLLSRHVPNCGNLQEAIFAIDKKIQDSEAALKNAAQESFGRLLQALSPEQLRKNVDPGPTKIGPFLKAALYEEFEEKHLHLLAYHNKGFLARDMKDSYRRLLKPKRQGDK